MWRNIKNNAIITAGLVIYGVQSKLFYQIQSMFKKMEYFSTNTQK